MAESFSDIVGPGTNHFNRDGRGSSKQPGLAANQKVGADRSFSVRFAQGQDFAWRLRRRQNGSSSNLSGRAKLFNDTYNQPCSGCSHTVAEKLR
jgi:hypothetical protein